ncbi:SET domain-containing protein, partial [Exidia glandulosa HHB12029]
DKQPGDEEVDQNPSFTVDAFHAGNFTRFLNHCCDPNCVIVAVHIDEPHIRKPHLCIFTRRAVACDEELTFSYFGIDDDEKQMSKRRASFTEEDEHVKGMDCFCGADNCVGRFFRV